MNLEETGIVLAQIQLIDNRIITPAVIAVWADILKPYELSDAMTAVTKTRRWLTTYLMPAHIVDQIKQDIMWSPENDKRIDHTMLIEKIRTREIESGRAS